MSHGLVREISIWGLIALAVAFGVNTWRVNSGLKSRVQELARQATDPVLGTYVPEVRTSTTDGQPAVLGREGELQLLFFFNETCPYCRSSTPAWKVIAEAVEAGVRIYGVSFDSTAGAATYRQAHDLPFPVISRPSARFAAVFRVPSVPLVMAVRPDGRIGYSRKGLMEKGAAVDSVVSAISTLIQDISTQQSSEGVAKGNQE
jgi:peroxiredoxin